MSYGSLTSLLSVIAIHYLIHHVSAYRAEAIVGGKITFSIKYKYQVSIQSAKNDSQLFVSVCSGSIIGNEYVLSAAFCFVDSFGNLAEQSFSVLLAANNLTDRFGIRINVAEIYLPGFEDNFKLSNIAVIKLKENLDVQNDPRLAILELPPVFRSYRLRTGTVTGYGHSQVKTTVDVFGVETRINGSSRGYLKVINVKILEDRECKKRYPSIFSLNQMCGITIPQRSNQHWGICAEDIGAPLVIENVVVGVASIHPVNCDDTFTSSVYVNVSYFSKFIRKIMEGFIPSKAIVHTNRLHL